MQSVPIPLINSLFTAFHSNNNIELRSSSISNNIIREQKRKQIDKSSPLQNKNKNKNKNKTMPKSSYNETAISTELECFITKSSSSDSIRIVDEDDINDIDLHSSTDSNDEFETNTRNKIELISIDDLTTTPTTDNKIKIDKYHKKKHRKRISQYHPEWLLYLSSLDKLFSSKIHKLSCGTIDYLFVFGAFVFGSKFMPITILLSIFLVDIPGFIYLLLSCTITVTFTQFGKKLFRRHRPDPKLLAPKKLDFRTRLTNYSFPSGDTAQAAAYSTSLFCLTHNIWLLLLIPNCAWSRVYFGCHWICDCIMGAIVGCFIPLFIWSMIPQQSFINTQQTILNWMH